MYVCVYVCVCLCVCVCVYTCKSMPTQTHAKPHAHTQALTHTYIHIYMYIYLCVCTYMISAIEPYSHMYLYRHIYTYNIYIHAHVHITLLFKQILIARDNRKECLEIHPTHFQSHCHLCCFLLRLLLPYFWVSSSFLLVHTHILVLQRSNHTNAATWP